MAIGLFALDHKPVEVFREQQEDHLRHRAYDPGLDAVDFVENGQSPVLKDRIGIQYEEPGFHKWRVLGKK